MPELTLERIAELSGVSRSTVSRVINGHKRVSATVRERVLKVIAETGYQPDRAAQLLASRRPFARRALQRARSGPGNSHPKDSDRSD